MQRHHNHLLDQKFMNKLHKWTVDPFDPSVLSLDDTDDMDDYYDDEEDDAGTTESEKVLDDVFTKESKVGYLSIECSRIC